MKKLFNVNDSHFKLVFITSSSFLRSLASNSKKSIYLDNKLLLAIATLKDLNTGNYVTISW